MSSSDGELPAARRRQLEAFLDESMHDHDVPGLSVALLDGDGLLYAEGLGTRDIDSRAPATADTLFPLGSVTKTVTAVAVLQLCDRGALDLDDEIRAYTDFLTDVPGDPITVADLLTHTHGVPDGYVGWRGLQFPETPPASPLVSRADTRRHVDGVADRRITDPDTYIYGNLGYQVLAEIVGEVTDRSPDRFVEEAVFDPLGMDRSQVGFGALSEVDDDAMTPYEIEDGAPVATEHDLDAGTPDWEPVPDVLSSARDLAALVRCLLEEGDHGGTQVLAPETVAAMCQLQAPAPEAIDGRQLGYGYGLQVGELFEERLADHTGSTAVSRAYVGMLPERGLGVTMGINTPGVPIGSFGRGVLAIAAGEAPEAVVPSLALRAKLEAVAGTYEGYREGPTVRVAPADSGGHIVVSFEEGLRAGWEFPAFPESVDRDDYTFYTVDGSGVREPVTFHETDDGMELRRDFDRLTRTST